MVNPCGAAISPAAFGSPGSLAVLPQWAVHRDPRWWDHPLAFDPDRFLPECDDQRPKFAYSE